MVVSLSLVVVGLLMLVAGGEVMLRGAVGLATLARLTPAVIGMTVVAAGTSVPELAVSATAAIKGSQDIAVGNVVGSSIFNLLFILGLAALVRPLAITGNTIRLEYPVLLLVTLMCLAVADDGTISRLDAVLFVATYIGFTTYLVKLVRGQMNLTLTANLDAEVAALEPAAEHAPPPPKLWVCLGFLTAGVALLGLGANATVAGAVELGRMIGLSERVIGLTIVAGGTGLPEVVTSLVSSIRGRDDVAIGNVIGSNLFNILGVLGLNGLIAPIPVAPAILASDNWWLMGATLLLFPLIFTGRRLGRVEGAFLLGIYAAYLYFLLTQPDGTV